MKKILFIFVLLLIGITSCKKAITEPRGGIFRGTFTKTGLNGGGEFTGDVSLALNDNQMSFVLAVDSTSEVPYPCGGTYSIIDATKIKFYCSYEAPLGGDQNMILDSVYNYTFDDTRFEFNKLIDTIKYEYNLIRY
jgi:hypothetical protein